MLLFQGLFWRCPGAKIFILLQATPLCPAALFACSISLLIICLHIRASLVRDIYLPSSIFQLFSFLALSPASSTALRETRSQDFFSSGYTPLCSWRLVSFRYSFLWLLPEFGDFSSGHNPVFKNSAPTPLHCSSSLLASF